MAEFLLAIMPLMELESRIWSNVKTDLGKETYAGISRVYWPAHPVWVRVDAVKKDIGARIGRPVTPDDWKAISDALAKDKEAQRVVDEFYRDWWNRMRLTEIKSQKVAFFLFQASVNFGEEKVCKWAQVVCNTNGQRVSVDGNIGPQTVSAINSIAEADFLADAATLQRNGYLMSILNDSSQIANKKGWERRIQKSL